MHKELKFGINFNVFRGLGRYLDKIITNPITDYLLF